MKNPLYLIIIILSLTFTSCNQEAKQESSIDSKANLNQLLTEQEGYIKIQMIQLKSGHLKLNATVNKVKGSFILDTGSSTTIIDSKHRKKFRLITKKTEKIAKTANGSQLKMKKSKNNTLEFEELKIKNFSVSLVNLNHINYSFMRMGIVEVDGIIGSDLLNSRKAVIDYANLVLYFKK